MKGQTTRDQIRSDFGQTFYEDLDLAFFVPNRLHDYFILFFNNIDHFSIRVYMQNEA